MWPYNKQIDPPAPFLDIVIRHPVASEQMRRVAAKLDTGADVSAIPQAVAADLGLLPAQTINLNYTRSANPQRQKFHTSPNKRHQEAAMTIPEQEWKLLSRLKPLTLDRLCRRILGEAQELIAAAGDGEHHRAYLALYRHIQERDRLLADCFDGLRRSSALFSLMRWRQHNLITDEEFAGFSPETRDSVDSWLARTSTEQRK